MNTHCNMNEHRAARKKVSFKYAKAHLALGVQKVKKETEIAWLLVYFLLKKIQIVNVKVIPLLLKIGILPR